MHLFRKVLVSLVAGVALGAVSVASASAASWHVGGGELAGSANLAEATSVTQSFIVEYPSVGVKIECTGLGAKEAKITAPNAGKVGSLVFKGCSFVGTAKCSLEGTEIKTKPLNVTASAGTGSEVRLNLAPEGSTFMTYTLKGRSCSLAGVNTVAGHAIVGLAGGAEERAEQELVANTGAGELEPVTLKGRAKLKLESGANWSFH